MTLGKPCTDEEVGVLSGSWKWVKKTLGFGNASVGVNGPGVSADAACVDLGQVVNRTAAEGAHAVITNNGMVGQIVPDISGETRARQMQELGL